MSKNLSELSARQGLNKNLFESLSQEDASSTDIAREFLVGKASVTGTISFYDFLKEDNKHKQIYICNGSACLCAGTQDKLHKQLQQHFPTDQIGHMTCLGRCHENSAFYYKGKNYSGLKKAQIDALLLDQQTPQSIEKYHVGSLGQSILTATTPSLEQLYNVFKTVLKQKTSITMQKIKDSALRGRGGAGFPISIKLQAVHDSKGSEKYLICNADEGDPGAYSDRFLLEHRPHLVLFGMMVAAYLSGAKWGVLYIRAEYPEAIDSIEQAIAEIHKMNLLGENIDGSGFDFNLKIISAQGAYICGEETALINSIEGQRPEVRVRPPFPSQQGLFNKPTVVNNVETLANIYSIITKGGDFYNSLGTDKSKGTKLVSLDSFFNKPGIYEVEMGTQLSEVFEKLGGGFKQDIKAVHIGGPLGGIIPTTKIKDLTIDFESFSDHGFLLGHASVVCIPKGFPMIKYLQHLFEFAAYESCGKCFPCRLGTKRGEELLTNATLHNKRIDRQLFDDLLDTLEQGSLCAHGGGIPLPVRNALQYFQSELQQWFVELH
ncbi:MAG: NAD(P)H-dependent oxidoreductase subunit E [Proteobacteria bacterium]|nr:NAD(P)H-dependent oxidoreductase subunit E [Pseudomonadota bacterium]